MKRFNGCDNKIEMCSSASKKCKIEVPEYQKISSVSKRNNIKVSEFQKISSNVDVMIYIYKMLEFGDQLRLAMTSDHLRNIFENFVVNKRYPQLSVLGYDSKSVVGYLKEANLMCLKNEDYHNFELFYADQVKSLSASYDCMPNVMLYRNVTKLQYKFSAFVNSQHLQMVADNCTKLEELRLEFCGNRQLDNTDMEELIDVDVLEKITNLKSFRLIDAFPTTIPYQNFVDIVTRLNLEQLEVSSSIVPDGTEVTMSNITLKELSIRSPITSASWSNNYGSFLGIFKNIAHLRLRPNDVITEAELKTLAAACKNVEKYTLDWAAFKNVKNFTIPPKVTDLSLIYCEGLSYQNLKQVLTHPKLKRFVSSHTHYDNGVFEEIQISPSIETLHMDVYLIHNVVEPTLVSCDYTNLKDISVYNMEDTDDMFPLTQCINLETLTLNSGNIPETTLLKLKSLRKLTITHKRVGIDWLFVLTLLKKHSTLTELDAHRAMQPLALTKCYSGFVTNVKRLVISYSWFLNGLTFWMHMVRLNPDLQLICENCRLEKQLLHRLVCYPHFPRNVRALEVSGCRLKCDDLRKNYLPTMQKFRVDTHHIRILYGGPYRLTIARNLSAFVAEDNHIDTQCKSIADYL